MTEFHHVPVMPDEVINGLNIDPDGIYVDGTVGGAGHSLLIAGHLSENGRLICLDQDEEAVNAATGRLQEYSDRALVIRSNYCNMREVLKGLQIENVNGILLDIGVSSYQLDTASRGFSYMEDAPLDMRMDNRNPLTAAQIVNNYTESELFRMIRDYGEDNFARNIAKHICLARQQKPIETTLELSDIIRGAIPMRVQKTGGHPAMRTFQAIRIEVNHELEVLESSLDMMIDLLAPGGRIAVITFHSLEDRIVKAAFRRNENPCTCPPDFPVCVCGKKSRGRLVNRKPIIPTDEEMKENGRSRSAKLRVFEKTGAGGEGDEREFIPEKYRKQQP